LISGTLAGDQAEFTESGLESTVVGLLEAEPGWKAGVNTDYYYYYYYY